MTVKSTQPVQVSVSTRVFYRLWPAIRYSQIYESQCPVELAAVALLAASPPRRPPGPRSVGWYNAQPHATRAGEALADQILACTAIGNLPRHVESVAVRVAVKQWLLSHVSYLPPPSSHSGFRFIGIAEYWYLLLSCTSPLCGLYTLPSPQWLQVTAAAVYSGDGTDALGGLVVPPAAKGLPRRRLS